MAVDEAFDCRLLKRRDSEDTDLVTDTGGTLLSLFCQCLLFSFDEMK